MKGALTLFAQDAASKLVLYTAADIQREEADEQVVAFLSFWKRVRRGVRPMLVFDSRFTTYAHLSQLNGQNVRFITLRRRGKRLEEKVGKIQEWNRITIPHDKRKDPRPLVHDSRVALRGYDGEVRQIIVRDNGHEKPAFIITNDFEAGVELVVGHYARRWRVENGIAEAVNFHLNALSSPTLIKVHFDVVMTMIADTRYSELAQSCAALSSVTPGNSTSTSSGAAGRCRCRGGGHVTVTYPRRAHNPIRRAVPWPRLPQTLPGLDGPGLTLRFE
jgi:hypothetical protein